MVGGVWVRVWRGPGVWVGGVQDTFPTAASPRRTSLTLLLGLGAEVCCASAIALSDFGSVEVEGEDGRLARRLRPTLYADTLVFSKGREVRKLVGRGSCVCDRC